MEHLGKNVYSLKNPASGPLGLEYLGTELDEFRKGNFLGLLLVKIK